MPKKHVSGLLTLTLMLAIVAASNIAHAQTPLVLYDFNSPTASDPSSFVWPAVQAQGQDGNVYTTSNNGGVFSGVLGQGLGAVSYTHLTLPTILRV